MDFADKYIRSIVDNFAELKTEQLNSVIEAVWNVYLKGQQVFIMGNGGSAAIASHFACDLGKTAAAGDHSRFRALSLNDNIPLLTALANDNGYESVFVEQLKNLACEGDAVIAISSSGNSENMVRAIDFANTIGAESIAITGFGGGKISNTAKYNITLNICDYGIVESSHLFICHLIADFLKIRLNNLH